MANELDVYAGGVMTYERLSKIIASRRPKTGNIDGGKVRAYVNAGWSNHDIGKVLCQPYTEIARVREKLGI